jgi:uncharacterized protein YjdB
VPRHTSRRSVALAAVALLLAACGGGDGGPPAPAPVADVRLAPTTLDLEPGQSAPLSAAVVDATGGLLAGRPVTWATANAAVATVSTAGVVTAVADGTTTVTASAEGRAGTATVTVRSRVATVEITPGAAEVVVGGPPVQLTAQARSGAGTPLARPVQWVSQQTAVATVSATGLVTAASPGTATITATSDGVSGAVTVQVLPDPCTVVRTLQVGQLFTGTLTATDCRLSDNTPIQVFEFTLSTRATVEILMNSTTVDPYLFLANDSLLVLDEDDDGGVGLNARILRRLDPGRYFVIANTFAAGTFGSYQLVVQPAPAACVTGRTIAIPSTTDATLSTTSCRQRDGSFENRYDITLAQPRALRIDMTSTAVDPYLVLLDDNEAVIAKNDDGGAGTDARLEVELAAGTYTILTRGRPGETGAYRLQVAPAIDPCDVTRTLTLGQPVQEVFAPGNCALSDRQGGPVRFFQRWGLVLSASTNVRIDMTSTVVDAYLVLQDAATGAVVTENDDAGPGTLNARIVATLPAGAYIVNATTFRTGEVGPFTVSAVAVPPQNVTVAVSPSTLTLQVGQTQQLSATVSGTTNTAVTWQSSADGIATVSASGLVRGITAGSATVTVRSQADPSRTATVAVTVGQAAGSVNLDIPAAYLVQAVQQLDGRVPLVANRDAVARVFVRGSQPGLPAVGVRVRVVQGGTTLGTYTGTATPNTTVDEACCSANLLVPGAVIRPGIALLAEVDPDNTVPETNENDNRWPLSGTPQPLDVVEVPPYSVRLVPVAQNRNGQTGAANESLFNVLRSLWPLNVINASVRAPFVIDYTIGTQSFNDWIRLVTDMETLRQIEGGATYYYGLVRTRGTSGVLGLANGIPARTAIGVDEGSDFGPTEARLTFAHEMGHTLGLRHAPCGGAAGPDPAYPFPDGRTGAFGLDLFAGGVLKGPSGHDIMTYCPNQWVSAYNYRKVLDFRQQNPQGAVIGPATDVLLVTGVIRSGAVTVDPAFSLVMPPAANDPAGRYVLEAFDADGEALVAHRFTPYRVEDAGDDVEAFVQAVPLPAALRDRVARLEVRDLASGRSAVRRSTLVGAATLAGSDAVGSTRRGDLVRASWSAARVPAVLVRDRTTGEVLGLLRRGEAELSGFGAVDRLELLLSYGTGSERVRVDARTGGLRP